MKPLVSVCYKGLSSATTVSPKSGRVTVRQKDLWFESSTSVNGGEDQALMEDSHLTERISRSQLDSSLTRRERGRAALIHFYSCPNWSLHLGLHSPDLHPRPPNQIKHKKWAPWWQHHFNTALGISSQRCASVDDACCCLSRSSRAPSRNVDEQIAVALLRLQRDMATIMHRLDTLEALALSQVNHFWCLYPASHWNSTNILFFSVSLVKIMFSTTGAAPSPGQKGQSGIML